MPLYAEVAVQLPGLKDLFSYQIPGELEGILVPGCLVTVPFRERNAQGVVIGVGEVSPVLDPRLILELVDPLPVLQPWQLVLARQMAEETLSSLSDVCALMIPAGLAQHADTLYHLQYPTGELPSGQTISGRILRLLKARGDLRGAQLDAALPKVDWRLPMRSLVKNGLVSQTGILPPPKVRPKLIRTVRLVASPERTAHGEELSRDPEVRRRRQAVLDFLASEGVAVAVQWVIAQTSATMADLQKLAEKDLILLSETEVWRDPLVDYEPVSDAPPRLTGDQQAAVDQIRGLMADLEGSAARNPVILHGVTGSGKTEIYLQAVAQTLAHGRQALVLVPEISLTPQTVRRFMSRFPGQVGLIHSRLSPGERYDTWRRARAGLLPVIVGPRSALFSPLPHPGLIVVDEFHESSYYQEETPPYYHALAAAIQASKAAHALCLLGSATPDVVTRFRAETEHWAVIRLPDRILSRLDGPPPGAAGIQISTPSQTDPEGKAHQLPPVQLVDMREELQQGNRSIFSRALRAALGQVLDAGQQAILFLNRRGTATYVFCRECGTVVKCPRCEIPLTLHTGGQLVCHRCGYRRALPKTCSTCGSSSIRAYGVGTEAVEAQVQQLFPEARVLRWDADTTRQKNSNEIILAHFAAHRADVLVGTQMIAKGLDLPFVTLVGVILADAALNLPDYRAAERTYQLLAQVAGRAGRSSLGGQVILQTYSPDHYAIRYAARHDDAGFYAEEIENRRRLGYPPFSRLTRLEFRHLDPEKAAGEAEKLARLIQARLSQHRWSSTELIGPVPCFFARRNGLYRWQIVLRGSHPAGLLAGLSLNGWKVQIDPPDLL